MRQKRGLQQAGVEARPSVGMTSWAFCILRKVTSRKRVHKRKKFKDSVYILLVSNLVCFFAITEQKICEMYACVWDAS